MMEAITAFLDAMAKAGIVPLEPIDLTSGNLCRFPSKGDKPGRRNGWAILHLDGPAPCGAFGNWRAGVTHKWRLGDCGHTLSRAERRGMAQAARQREAQRQAEIAHAADCARDLWQRAEQAKPDHPYIARKGLAPYGLRQSGGDLLVPLVDADGLLWNLQRIRQDGAKLFLRGGRTKGLFWPGGVWAMDGKPSSGPLVIAEGWATAAAIHEATGFGVVAAMNAGNLLAVAEALRGLFPDRCMIVAADWDGAGGGIGLDSARKAAQASRAHLATPITPDQKSASASLKIDFADIPRAAARVLILAAMHEGAR